MLREPLLASSEGAHLDGVLDLPGRGRWPCVIAAHGLFSTKASEKYLSLAAHFTEALAAASPCAPAKAPAEAVPPAFPSGSPPGSLSSSRLAAASAVAPTKADKVPSRTSFTRHCRLGSDR